MPSLSERRREKEPCSGREGQEGEGRRMGGRVGLKIEEEEEEEEEEEKEEEEEEEEEETKRVKRTRRV